MRAWMVPFAALPDAARAAVAPTGFDFPGAALLLGIGAALVILAVGRLLARAGRRRDSDGP